MAYTILISSQHLYRKIPPKPAHIVFSNLSMKVDQSKLRCYNCGKLGHLSPKYSKQPQPGPTKFPPMKKAKLNHVPARVVI